MNRTARALQVPSPPSDPGLRTEHIKSYRDAGVPPWKLYEAGYAAYELLATGYDVFDARRNRRGGRFF